MEFHKQTSLAKVRACLRMLQKDARLFKHIFAVHFRLQEFHRVSTHGRASRCRENSHQQRSGKRCHPKC